jgi:4'-phosphopantetheinyl transferase
MTGRPDKVRIELWRWTLQAPEADIALLRRLLSQDEIARAERFVRPIHGRRYIAGRGRLRQIISAYLGCDPVAVEILTDKYGKPFVAPDPAGALHFNLSHSQDQALLAVSRDLPLGVDIEMIRPIEERVERIFSPAEQQALASLTGADWTIGFYNCWTRKEAFVKALGHGLSLPLDDFDVSLRPGEPARLISHRADPDAPKCWKLIPLEVQPGFAGALAVASWDAPIELIDRTAGGVAPAAQ